MENLLKTKTLTGAEIIVKTLQNLGVEKIFGYPGGIVLKIYDELYKQNEIQHILVRHEQAAVHAAEGYARVSGKAGVVLVTSGPGATNTVSGIVNAYLDGAPLVVLTGQVTADLIGKDAFQEADICDITRSCTKKVYQVKSVKELEKTLYDAFNTAISGKKGPVVVDLAKNILYENAELTASPNAAPACEVIPDVSNILKELSLAKRPVIVTGGGAKDAYKEVRELNKILKFPVVTTMMGLGVYPAEDENYFGMIGIFGDRAANAVIKESDLIFSIGARFNDRITCCFEKTDLEKKFIQLDINEREISRVIKAHDFITGDAKIILAEMIKSLAGISFSAEWGDTERFRALNVKREAKTNMLQSFEVMRELDKFICGKDLTVTTEVGQHQLWAAQNLHFSKPGKFLTSGGSGTMGFGFPAAIGAAVYDNSKPVVCVAGDGSFQMNLQELATCRDYDLPVKILILNNGYLGMVRQLQEKQCDGRYFETKISNPDFMKIAESYGLKGLRVHNRSEILPALEKAFTDNKTCIVEFIIEPMEVL